MAKYPGTYTTKDVCNAEVKECKQLLKKYHVSPEDVKEITGMIEQAYYMLDESYRVSQAFEAYVQDELGDDMMSDFFAKWMSHSKEPGKHLADFIKKQEDEYWKRAKFQIVDKKTD